MTQQDNPFQHHEEFLTANHGRLKSALMVLRDTLSEERQETRVMLEIYYRHAQGRATPEDMHHANQQFVELIRYMALGILLILPMAPVSIPLIVKLGQRMGIEVLPGTARKSNTPPPK